MEDHGLEPGRARRGPLLGGFLVLASILSVVSLIAMIRSLVTMTYLNIRFRGEVDPFSRAVSYYVFYGDGREDFATSVIVLAAGTLTTLIGLRAAGLRLGTPATAFFAVWCTSLTLCAIFPTDNGKSIGSTSGLIHQIAGASLFVSLPLAGLSLAKRLAHRPGVIPFAGSLTSGTTRFRVLPTDDDAAKNSRPASNPGR